MYVKLHKSYRTVVAICDADLIGKTFEEKFENGIKQLDIRESFYKGDNLEYQKVVEIMKFQSKEDANFNIVGPNAVKAAKEAGIVNDKGIGKIGKVPYALVLL